MCGAKDYNSVLECQGGFLVGEVSSKPGRISDYLTVYVRYDFGIVCHDALLMQLHVIQEM